MERRGRRRRLRRGRQPRLDGNRGALRRAGNPHALRQAVRRGDGAVPLGRGNVPPEEHSDADRLHVPRKPCGTVLLEGGARGMARRLELHRGRHEPLLRRRQLPALRRHVQGRHTLQPRLPFGRHDRADDAWNAEPRAFRHRHGGRRHAGMPQPDRRFAGVPLDGRPDPLVQP